MFCRRSKPLFLALLVIGVGVGFDPGARLWVETQASPAQTVVDVSVQALRCEYKVNPIGIDVLRPRLSWQIVSPRRGTLQSACQIRVAADPAVLQSGNNLLWDTGKINSDQSVHVDYQGPELESRKRYYWQVRVWDESGRPAEWSEPAFWEMGLLDPSDWSASWIRPDLQEDTSTPQPAPMLRSEFQVDGEVSSARAYVTSLGLYEMELNGRKVTDQVFTPGWTSYHKRLQYQTYDVTELLKNGQNAVGVMLGDGWFRGYLGFRDQRNVYGERLALLLQINVRYEDGREAVFGSDPEWKSSTGPILMSDLYMGERYDARREKPGWSTAGYDDRYWSGVLPLEQSKEILVAPAGPPVRRIEEIKPRTILKTPAGETVFDMGQNMVGRVRLKVRGKRGRTVRLRHAEVLDREGNFYTENLRAAKQTVEYILKGKGEEVYEPHFTFQGFRYVAVAGLDKPALDQLTGIVIHSDMPTTGTFECSDPLINQLQHNIVWGQKGNFLDVPTDCPQRDERLGWTGDAQVFARTASFNMDVAGFFTKWLADLAADQTEDGRIPHVIPDVLGNSASAAWADAGVIIPWTMYLSYGDRRLLEKQYPSMKAWVDYMQKAAGEDFLWDSGFHYGDWLAYNTTRSDYPGATTDKDLIATSFFAYSTSLLERTARVLGKQADAEKYAALLSNIKSQFRREYVSDRGRLASSTQTAYALALQFDLLPEDLRTQAAARLVRDIRAFDDHLTTGFVGTPYLCHVLSRFGYLDVAYGLLNQKTYPSWLYPVTQGATTIWERWDGIKPDGSFQNPGMNSFNHYAYGAIGEWLYRVVAGIEVDPARPGYEHILIQPRPGGGLTSARASLEGLYGEIAVAWELTDQTFSLSVQIPPNTTATVRLPSASVEGVAEGGKALAQAEGIKAVVQREDSAVVEIGSGQYLFQYEWAGR